jgi:hypothetical protein
MAVAHFYDQSSDWTQCAVAGATLERTECCELPFSCDEIAEVKIALTKTGNLAAGDTRPMRGRALRAELGRGRPVVARIEWPDKTGHFVVIDGSRTGAFVRVKDPGDDSTVEMALNTLLHRYQSLGTCSHLYRTHA